jgi:hypothetical protein
MICSLTLEFSSFFVELFSDIELAGRCIVLFLNKNSKDNARIKSSAKSQQYLNSF